MKVKMIEWESWEESCFDQKNKIHEVDGWIKFIDDEGVPNIMTIANPCS